MRHGIIGVAQGRPQGTELAVLELGASAIFQINDKINPPTFGISTEISPDFTKYFRISTEISRISRISTKISGFRERFQISREILGKVYEISGSGGPLDFTDILLHLTRMREQIV